MRQYIALSQMLNCIILTTYNRNTEGKVVSETGTIRVLVIEWQKKGKEKRRGGERVKKWKGGKEGEKEGRRECGREEGDGRKEELKKKEEDTRVEETMMSREVTVHMGLFQ